MPVNIKKLATPHLMLSLLSAAISSNTLGQDQKAILEEVIVTAQKREQSLQQTPIAISVLNDAQLTTLGVKSLDGLIDGVIPSLRINPNGNAQSSLTVAIRGDGPSDVSQTTKQSSVGIYLDGIYLGRSQGLSMELADIQRIEVLRGPQGTLFGRNSTNGAISVVSHKPTGEFGLEQTLGAGNYDAFRSVTRVNLPTIAGLSTKFEYFHSERDGWVDNTLSGQADFNEFDKDGGRFSLNWQPIDSLNVDYAYDYSDVETGNLYFQVFRAATGSIPAEPDRQSKTRFPMPLDAIITKTEGHSVIASWSVSETLTIKSLTAYRELDEDGANNLGGAFGVPTFEGLIVDEDIGQEQYSQEFQFIGSTDKLEWSAGFFYFKEDTDFELQLFRSLDASFNPILPPTALSGITTSVGEAESIAIYGQGTWSFNDKLSLTAGARHTEDDKSASRAGFPSPDINSEHTDATIALSYNWLDNVSTYIKWATAYKAGGYNVRSLTFSPYDEEVNRTIELGLKSEYFDRRARFNAAIFNSTYKDKQFDFINPTNTLLLETLNASKEVEISGIELDFTVLPTEGLVLGLHYTGLDGDMPLQPNPLDTSQLQAFELIQTPRHAGALTVDHTTALEIGSLKMHLDIVSTDHYAYSTAVASRKDAYTLVNANVTLQEINLGNGTLSLSLWGKNLRDEEYVILGFNVGDSASNIIQSFGTPRTWGFDVTYEL